jgi:DNA-binding response OmpR family regulator
VSPPEMEPFFSTVTYEGEETAQAGGKQGVDERITILVVEDDHLIQAMLEEALSDGGFATATVASGEEAIAILKPDSSKSKVCAVLTDINLLGSLDGWEVARVAREIDPTMPVLYMSGTHADQWASRSVPQSVILLKPFAPAQVVTAVSNLINSAKSPVAPQ